jgi:DNA (cytosine-5)-methyltransferase 1
VRKSVRQPSTQSELGPGPSLGGGASTRPPRDAPRAIDLFSGAGGLTRGLIDAGFDVIGAIEQNHLAASSYEANFRSVTLWERDIRKLPVTEVRRVLSLGRGDLDLLAGCPPCEGFSSLRTRNGKHQNNDPRNDLIYEFRRFVRGLLPRYVMLENVPALETDHRFADFVADLKRLGYLVQEQVKNVADYGVPQRRRRLILLAGRRHLGPLPESPMKQPERTVRQAIANLPPAGHSGDRLHDHGEIRQPKVLSLISEVPIDGGSRSALGDHRALRCHKDHDGFYDVYGRMRWDAVAPTITGGCINPSKGRFLHPLENRAITLREAALLQDFPPDHVFSLERGKYATAELIGNAIPPGFVRHHAEPVVRAIHAISLSHVDPALDTGEASRRATRAFDCS